MNMSATQRKSLNVDLSPGAATGSQIFHTCCWLYLVAFFILSDGVGFRFIFLWSAKRIMLFICYGQILFNRERLTVFCRDVQKCVGPNIFLLLHEFIRFYTAVYRRDLYCIYGSILDEVMVFYLFIYILKHEITLKEFIRFIQIALTILCIEGLWEAATGVNLFGLISFAEEGWGVYGVRAGNSRICGNMHHSIGFGIYLSILFILSCVDVERNKLYLFRSPVLFVLTSVCVFLTGSRAPLGIYLMSIGLLCLFSGRDERIKSILILAALASGFALFTMLVYRTEIGRQIMFMLTAMWDAVFDTDYSINWGGSLRGSTEYRDALAKVFDLWYFNKLMGRGASYGLSVVIDGYWLRSCDNSYVGMYITYAYPGLAMMIGHLVSILGYAVHGFHKYRSALFAAAFLMAICYYINIWYVATMGTYFYMWMLFALTYLASKNQIKIKEDNTNEL